MKKRKAQRIQLSLSVLPRQPSFIKNKRSIPFVLGLFLLLFVFCFGSIVFGPNQFFLRDSGFFYYPLFEQIQREWASGQLPLWDQYENLGQPLLANPTSSVFYPGKLVFFLSSFGFLSYDACFKWYILLHFPLAFYWFYRLARHIGITRSGSTLGAFGWTFSGPILFATSNPVFLIGASWLPAGIMFADKTLRTGSVRNAAGLAAVLALIVLGGDPQAAWLCVFLSFGLSFVVFRRRKSSRKIVLVHGGMLLAGIVVGVLACAVQVLPGLDMKRNIDRGAVDAPLSIWEWAGNRLHDGHDTVAPKDPLFAQDTVRSERNHLGVWDNMLCRRLDQPGHASSIYRFSLPPWRLGELIFPNVGGDWVSGRGRWFAMLPHDDQLWTASLYMGIVPFLLAVWAFFPYGKSNLPRLSRRRTRGYRAWAVVIVVLATLAAFGAFGPAWLIRVMCHNGDNCAHNGDPVGGLYWFMVVFLPQFATFRYPAKLTVIITLALALLAGMGLDRLRSRQNGARLATFVFVPSGILCILTVVLGPVWLESFNGRTFAGSMPLDALAVSRSLAGAFGQTALVAFLFWLILTWAKRDSVTRHAAFMMVLVLTVFDLAWAHRLLIPSIPEEAYRSKSLVTQTIQEDRQGGGTDLQPIRVWRGIQWNPLLLTNENDRFQRAFALDRKTIAPKYSYSQCLGIANVHGTGIEQSYRRFLEQLETMSRDESQQERMLEMLARCNVRYLVLPWQDQQGKTIVLSRAKLLDTHLPRQYSLISQPEQAFEHLDDPWPINTHVWRNDHAGNLLRLQATTETDATEALTTNDSTKATAKLTLYTSSRIEFDAICPSPCDVVVAEQFWNGWKTQAVSKENPEVVLRLPTNRDDATGFLRQVSLPKGSWHVTMVYRPNSVYWGLALSLVAWIVLIASWFIFRNTACRNIVF